MSDRVVWSAMGTIFVLLSTATAMGAVSLGTYQKSSVSYMVSGPYLAYNPFFGVLALLLALAGGYFFYESGKSSRTLTARAN